MALEDYNKSIELDPSTALTYNNRGMTRYEGENFQDALYDFNKAIKLDPLLAVAYNNRGYCYYYIEQYDDACNDLNYASNLGYPVNQEDYSFICD